MRNKRAVSLLFHVLIGLCCYTLCSCARNPEPKEAVQGDYIGCDFENLIEVLIESQKDRLSEKGFTGHERVELAEPDHHWYYFDEVVGDYSWGVSLDYSVPVNNDYVLCNCKKIIVFSDSDSEAMRNVDNIILECEKFYGKPNQIIDDRCESLDAYYFQAMWTELDHPIHLMISYDEEGKRLVGVLNLLYRKTLFHEVITY